MNIPKETKFQNQKVEYESIPGTVKLIVEKFKNFSDLSLIDSLEINKIIPEIQPGERETYKSKVSFEIRILCVAFNVYLSERYTDTFLHSGICSDEDIASYGASLRDFDRTEPILTPPSPRTPRSPSYSPAYSPAYSPSYSPGGLSTYSPSYSPAYSDFSPEYSPPHLSWSLTGSPPAARSPTPSTPPYSPLSLDTYSTPSPPQAPSPPPAPSSPRIEVIQISDSE